MAAPNGSVIPSENVSKFHASAPAVLLLVPYRNAPFWVVPPCNTIQYVPAGKLTDGEIGKSTQPAACPSCTATTELCAFNAPGAPDASA